MTTDTTRLTNGDRRVIVQARALAACRDEESLREHIIGCGLIEPDEAIETYPAGFGYASMLLASLADIAKRLGGGHTGPHAESGVAKFSTECPACEAERLGGGCGRGGSR